MKKTLLTYFVVLMAMTVVIAQDREVSGKVTAADDGSPLPGVNVVLKGTTNGAVTDANGAYRLSVPAAGTLVFSFIGYQTTEAEIGDRSVIDVRLGVDVQQLTEVVVTGYSTQNVREVAGSISSVKGESVGRVPIASFDQSLQGQVAGVLIQSQSGQPGAAASVLIRGKGSINGTNTPLFILDGIEISAADFGTMNPADFETYSVLKDASATAIYGSRGANGVIVITSKKGKKGRAKVTYDAQYGFSKAPENKLDLMNSEEKLQYELDNGNPYGWTDPEVDALSQINTNWEKVFFRTGKTQSHTINLSGASDNTSYFISGSYFDQTGTVTNTGLKRYTGRVNVESKLDNVFFGINSTFGYSTFSNTGESNTGIATPLNAIRWLNPYEKPYDDNGEYTDIVSGQPNALEELLENNNTRLQYKAIGNIFLGYNVPFVKGLTIKTNWGGDFTSNERSQFINGTTATGGNTPSQKGSLTRQFGKRFRYTGTTSISYAKQIGSDHNLSVSLFNEIVKANSNSFFFTGFGLGGPFNNEAGITPGTATNGFIPAVGANTTDGFNGDAPDFRGGPSALLSYFTLINYGYKDRYFFTITGRRDGSSRFGANYRTAYFGSVAGSWIVSDESFMAGVTDIFNALKFKASYGSSGNQAGIGTFQPEELYGRAVYNGVAGLVHQQYEQPDLRWEKKTTFNTGIEFTTLNSRLNGTIEFYDSKTTDMFLGRPLSLTSGYPTILANIGGMRNTGFELSLSGDVIKRGDFRWTVSGNITWNKNRITKLLDNQDEIDGGGLTTLKVGESFNSIKVVRQLGVNPDNGNAIYQKADGSTTEVYDPLDRVIIGSYEAPYFGGFGTSLSYKGIEASALFSFVLGNDIYNNDRNNVVNPDYLWDNLSRERLREWRNPGDITDVPGTNNVYYSNTTYFVESGDFLRLRNVMVSYSLPASVLSKIKLSNVKIFAQGQNLLTFTKFLGFDPEISTGSLVGAQYPALRTTTFGLTIGL